MTDVCLNAIMMGQEGRLRHNEPWWNIVGLSDDIRFSAILPANTSVYGCYVCGRDRLRLVADP